MSRKKKKSQEEILIEVTDHYTAWTDDMAKRMTRKDGWNDVTDAFWGKLPDNWPFLSRIVDPVAHTTLLEKNARLMNGKLRGRLAPREGGDMVGAEIHNALLDHQWDNAMEGGSMQVKVSMSDQDTRLYGSKFAETKWKCEYDDDGNVVFEGNEMIPKDIRDCGMDFGANHIRNAKWFQCRTWEFLEDLENVNDVPGLPVYKNLDVIRGQIVEGYVRNSRRDSEWTSRVKQLKGLTDRVGEDKAFPVIEIVTEYRKDRWITFSPEFNVIIRDIPNPYKHKQIPFAQLRYYATSDDAIGESELEPVLPLWRAIQATLCAFLDEVMLKMRPPLKVLDGQARVETIVYGPEAQWLVDRVDAITEVQSNGEAVRYFQTTYGALKAAFNTAMGDTSQGIGGVDPFNPEKTATEIKKTEKQQNTRDQKNQNDLAEFLQDIMRMWVSNNEQFLFRDPKKHEYVLRIIGQEKFNYFKRLGMDQMEVSDESMQMISDIVQAQGGNLSDEDINELYESAKTPKYPIIENPDEKDPDKYIIKPKMRLSELEDSAEVSLVPEDLNGNYDYIADVKSMASGASEDLLKATQQALTLLTGNQQVIGLLAQEGFAPSVKELIGDVLTMGGLYDSTRYFRPINQGIPPQAGTPETAGLAQNQGVGGLPTIPQASAGGSNIQQMGGPALMS